MPGSDKQSRSECSAPDLACTRCRERKIRCDRERPHCGNCDKEDGATCTYQTPPKRVNHLKLLCDSIDRLHNRLSEIESHLERLSSIKDQNYGRYKSVGIKKSKKRKLREASEESDESEEWWNLQPPDQDTKLRSKADATSLAALCEQFQQHTCSVMPYLKSDPLKEKLRVLCDTASASEPFVSGTDQNILHIPPKQQVHAAVEKFFHHVDPVTDIFVPSHLLTSIDAVYSGMPKIENSDQEPWIICFRTITLLVLGIEISTQHSSATLLGDFAHTLLPSSSALVTPRLLTTPNLINIQVLILLSVAAQQLDPPGWAEIIFAHACMLARMKGIHKAELYPPENADLESIERSKVLRSLFIRDRALCTNRGAVSWLHNHNGDIISRMSAGIGRPGLYSANLELAVIQDQIHHITRGYRDYSVCSFSRVQGALMSIDAQLQHFAAEFGVLDGREDISCPQGAFMPLEFLATRILAFRQSLHPVHKERALADSKAACLLFLTSNGEREQKTVDSFYALVGHTGTCHTPGLCGSQLPHSVPFSSTLNAFPVASFFILMEEIMSNGAALQVPDTDINLLERVADCYTQLTAWMQPNSYHSKVARVFNQLLEIAKMASRMSIQFSTPCKDDDVRTGSVHQHANSIRPAMNLIESTQTPPQTNMLTFEDWTPNSNVSPIVWPAWLSVSSSQGPDTPAGPPDAVDAPTPSQELFTQLVTPSSHSSDYAELPIQFHTLPMTDITPQKRQKLQEPQLFLSPGQFELTFSEQTSSP